MNGIAREYECAGLWQFHQQRLVAGRVTGCRDDRHAAVAEYVVVTFEFVNGMLRLEAPDAERARPLVFGLLHQQHCLREHFHIADVVGMGMRHGEIFDVGRLHAQHLKL